MAGAEKLLNEAEFAFRNISPDSTDERKYTARAKRLAMSIVRKYPVSSEAEQAQTILRHLGTSYATAKPAVRAARPLNAAAARGDSWQDIWQTLRGLSDAKKKVLAFTLLFFVAIIGAAPYLLALFLYYVGRPGRIRPHVHKLVVYFT